MPKQDPMRRPKAVSPAPWTLDPNNAAKVVSIDEHTRKRSTVALCVNPDVGIARAQANAQLIKTAPEMLHEADFASASLKSLVDEIRDGVNQCNELTPRIIASRLESIANDLGNVARKAKGESC